ncbi:MAG: GspJ family T2SS minor pseudopilin variant XcpW [Nevskia sp.]
MLRRSRGFTLLELIVVIGIFAIFAAMAYGGLNSVLTTRTQVEDRLSRTENYDRAYLRMRTDFQNASSRGVRGGDGQSLAGFTFDNYAKRIEFTRGGWQNLLNLPRATLERVSYFLDDRPPESARSVRDANDKRLVRRSWYVLDRAPQTQPVEIVLLDHVQQLSWRFLDDNRTWQDSWGGNGGNALGNDSANAKLPSPMAVEVRLTTKDWGDLKFLFALGAEGSNQIAKLLAAPPVPGGGTSGGTTGGTSTGDGGKAEPQAERD